MSPVTIRCNAYAFLKVGHSSASANRIMSNGETLKWPGPFTCLRKVDDWRQNIKWSLRRFNWKFFSGPLFFVCSKGKLPEGKRGWSLSYGFPICKRRPSCRETGKPSRWRASSFVSNSPPAAIFPVSPVTFLGESNLSSFPGKLNFNRKIWTVILFSDR